MITSLLLAAALNGQTAYTSQNPINVASCSVQPVTAPVPFSNGIPTSGSLSISFQNQNEEPVTSVAFNVSDGSTTQKIVETGTFSKGVTIEKNEDAPAFIADYGAVNCTVASVAFADGSVWQAQ